MEKEILKLTEKVLSGKMITFDEALLLNKASDSEPYLLMAGANAICRHYRGKCGRSLRNNKCKVRPLP